MVAIAMSYGRPAAGRVSRPSRDRVVASSNLWLLPCESESGVLLTMGRRPTVLLACRVNRCIMCACDLWSSA
jgi:hypothetical protein